MIDYAMSAFQTVQSMSNGDKRPVSFGRRLIGWIEASQQRKANDEIAKILRRHRS